MIELQSSQHNLFLVDGSRQVNIAYAMSTEVIRDYSARDSDVLARVTIPEDAFEGYRWFQIWQAKISLIFTRAMTDVRDDGTSSAFCGGQWPPAFSCKPTIYAGNVTNRTLQSVILPSLVGTAKKFLYVSSEGSFQDESLHHWMVKAFFVSCLYPET